MNQIIRVIMLPNAWLTLPSGAVNLAGANSVSLGEDEGNGKHVIIDHGDSTFMIRERDLKKEDFVAVLEQLAVVGILPKRPKPGELN